MYKILFAASLVFVVPFARAADDRKVVPLLKFLNIAKADISDVQLLESKQDIRKMGNYEHRYLILKIGVKAVNWGNGEITGLQPISGQTSLDSPLNPTDLYYRLLKKESQEISVGSSIENVSVELAFFVDSRDASESGKPWTSTPKESIKKEFTRYLNFDAGMAGGVNRWKLYHVNYSDLDNVKFTYKKTYASIQGLAPRVVETRG